jgi:hypothetical protein
MTMKSRSDISVPHTGGWLRLTVDVAKLSELASAEGART